MEKEDLLIIITSLAMVITAVIIAFALVCVDNNDFRKIDKKNKEKEDEYISAINIYETFTIPNLEKLIVKLGNDIPLNGEEREMLKDIITKEDLK